MRLPTRASALLCVLATSIQAKLLPADQLALFGQTPIEPLLLSPVAVSRATPLPQDEGKNTSQLLKVYTSKTFSGGRGMSIITTPDRIKDFANVDPLAEGTNEVDPFAPFEERVIPGKGRGLFATRYIHRGERIFATTPLVLIDSAIIDEDDDVQESLVKEAAEKLPPSSRDSFWDMYAQNEAIPARSRVDSNAFDVDVHGNNYFGVMPESARLNHDCRPNTNYFFDPDTLTHFIHAVTDIPPGTEITDTYIDVTMPRDARMAKLKRNWGFTCSCSLCSAHSKLSDASDGRLQHIQELNGYFWQSWEAATPAMAETLISLYQQERLYTSYSQGYMNAAFAYCAAGRHWETVKYAHLAHEATILDDGFHSGDVDTLKDLINDPESQTCWLRRERGRTLTPLD